MRFLRKLEDLKIGVLTYGLAFHIQQTKILRFPYNNEEFFEQVRQFVIENVNKLGLSYAKLRYALASYSFAKS